MVAGVGLIVGSLHCFVRTGGVCNTSYVGNFLPLDVNAFCAATTYALQRVEMAPTTLLDVIGDAA